MSNKTGARRAQPQKTCDQKLLARTKDAERERRAYWADPDKARAKGRRNDEKCRAQSKARYWSNPEKNRAQARERARTEPGRASNRQAVATYRQRHPEVVAAQREAQKALHRGELRVSLVCEIKGCRVTKGLHLHHPDYRKPRDTIRTCPRHHEHLHHRGPLELKPGAGRKWARKPRTSARAPD
jgi:hypothetical protein